MTLPNDPYKLPHPTLIQSASHCGLVCSSEGVSEDFEFVWNNPDTPGPQLDAVVRACKDIHEDLLVVLEARGWTNMPPPYSTGRISLSDLHYLGAWALPDQAPWRNLQDADITVMPNGNLGIKGGNGLHEFWIPSDTLIRRGAIGQLAQLQEVPGNHVLPASSFKSLTTISTGFRFSSCEFLDDTLVVDAFEFYNVTGNDHDTTCFFPGWTDLANPGAPVGAYHTGPKDEVWPSSIAPWGSKRDRTVFHSNKTSGGYIGRIPPHLVNTFGGRTLVKGRHRSAGTYGSGQGPQLYACFDEPRADGTLGGVPLMAYPFNSHTWSPYRKPNNYRCCWIWDPATERSAVLVGATEGQGPDWYGVGCNGIKGHYADPYRPAWHLVDPKDLELAHNGTIQPWEISQYESGEPTWGFDLPGSSGYSPACEENWFENMTWDEENLRLYVLQTIIEENGIKKRRSAVHVLELV